MDKKSYAYSKIKLIGAIIRFFDILSYTGSNIFLVSITTSQIV